VGTSVGIPVFRASGVSCTGGFFWEDHLPFFGVFGITKMVELAIYAFDPTLQGDLSFLDFMLKFLPSFLGYVDGYTDATAIVIAHSCDESPVAQNLAIWMCGTYFAGVVVGQWVVVSYLAMRDETHACFMKLIHMDALASSISLPEASQNTWYVVNMARTFGEDIPQAIQQTLFLIFVKQNYFMIASVAVSVASSFKALYDAIHRSAIAAGAKVTPASPEGNAEGDILQEQAAGMVPLKLFWSSDRKDNFSTSTAQGEADALAVGYKFIRVEGYVFQEQAAGMVPLKLFWSSDRKDNFSTSTAQGEADALAVGYRFIRVEGYVRPPN